MKLDVSLLKSVLTIYDEMENNGLSLCYLGEFNQDITKMFTSMAEDEMDRKSEGRAVKKKVYHVMVETLQNMNKHSDELADDLQIGKGLFMIGQKEETYFVITSNRITKDKRPSLESAIDQVNNATPEELKEMYKKQIREGSISDRGGAGLGLIDIARKTDEKLDYEFLYLNEDYYYFILKVEINSKKISERMEKKAEEKAANSAE
ncbi:MAG: hypothetical protein GY827_12510 [Cytophagales bacterium]|nr:hypothetical protein [Cytophagales bacterium]